MKNVYKLFKSVREQNNVHVHIGAVKFVGVKFGLHIQYTVLKEVGIPLNLASHGTNISQEGYATEMS